MSGSLQRQLRYPLNFKNKLYMSIIFPIGLPDGSIADIEIALSGELVMIKIPSRSAFVNPIKEFLVRWVDINLTEIYLPSKLFADMLIQQLKEEHQ